MSDDEDILVERDELNDAKMNGMLINVAPFDGVENIGYQDDIPETDVTQSQSSRNIPDVKGGENDFIVAIFVVVFDTKHGNEIEWKIPGNVDLQGVEFKALVSGSHTVSQDFVYFKHNQSFGLSCFGKMSVESEEERHARMKSVGIICMDYTSLHEHMAFLESQVRQQLLKPKTYDELAQYYHQFRTCPHKNNTLISPVQCGLQTIDDLPVLQITHPAGCFNQFIKYFEEKVFVLWKLVLLQKRILFFSPPPAGISSFRVYCTCLLGSHAVPFVNDWNPNPLFSVNLMDISQLSSREKYVACTTDKIFEMKHDVYDAFVDNQNVILSDVLTAFGRVTAADRKRYQQLCTYNKRQFASGEDVTDDETLYTRFFVEANNRLFKVLYEVASKEDRILTAEAVLEMGLDPYGDRLFIANIVDLYDIHVVLPDVVCC